MNYQKIAITVIMMTMAAIPYPNISLDTKCSTTVCVVGAPDVSSSRYYHRYKINLKPDFIGSFRVQDIGKYFIILLFLPIYWTSVGENLVLGAEFARSGEYSIANHSTLCNINIGIISLISIQ